MIKLKILVLFNLKFKKDILKLERILNYNAFKQISEKTYIGNLDNNEILVKYQNKVKYVTPGQACVLYLGEECLGGGIIKEVRKNNEKVWYL